MTPEEFLDIMIAMGYIADSQGITAEAYAKMIVEAGHAAFGLSIPQAQRLGAVILKAVESRLAGMAGDKEVRDAVKEGVLSLMAIAQSERSHAPPGEPPGLN